MPQFTKADLFKYFESHTYGEWPIPKNPLDHMFLGFFASNFHYETSEFCHAMLGSAIDTSELIPLPINPEHIVINELLERFWPGEGESRVLKDSLKMNLNVVVMTQPMFPSRIDMSAQDNPMSPWGQYLTQYRETGFCARSYHSSAIYRQIHEHALIKNDSTLLGEDTVSIAASIEINSDLGEDYRFTNSLHLAARSGCVELMRTFSESKEDLEQHDKAAHQFLRGLTPLHHAVLGFHTACVKVLIAEIAVDYTRPDHLGNTILHALACSPAEPEKQLATLESLERAIRYRERTNPDKSKAQQDFYQQKNAAGQNALQIAAKFNHAALVVHLLTVPGAKHTDLTDADFTRLKLDRGDVIIQAAALTRERTIENTEAVAISHHAFMALTDELSDTRERLAQTQIAMLTMGDMVRKMVSALKDSGIDFPALSTPDFALLMTPAPASHDGSMVAKAGSELKAEENDEICSFHNHRV